MTLTSSLQESLQDIVGRQASRVSGKVKKAGTAFSGKSSDAEKTTTTAASAGSLYCCGDVYKKIWSGGHPPRGLSAARFFLEQQVFFTDTLARHTSKIQFFCAIAGHENMTILRDRSKAAATHSHGKKKTMVTQQSDTTMSSHSHGLCFSLLCTPGLLEVHCNCGPVNSVWFKKCALSLTGLCQVVAGGVTSGWWPLQHHRVSSPF